MPEPLEQAVGAALAAMHAAPGHELAPEYRRAIYSALGPPMGERPPDRLRGLLAIYTARHVLPIFEQYRLRNDTKAADLIRLGEGVLNGMATIKEAETTLQIITGGDWPDSEMHPAGRAAGFAALRAVAEVLGYNGLNHDYDGSDSAMSAAIAVCAGWTLPHKKEPEKLQAFWEWWLLEAIATVWRAGQSLRRMDRLESATHDPSG